MLSSGIFQKESLLKQSKSQTVVESHIIPHIPIWMVRDLIQKEQKWGAKTKNRPFQVQNLASTLQVRMLERKESTGPPREWVLLCHPPKAAR